MNIEDFLQMKEFKSLDTKLNDEMVLIGGPILVMKMEKTFNKDFDYRNWFYSNNLALGNKRPYDACKEGDRDKVHEILDAINRRPYGVPL